MHELVASEPGRGPPRRATIHAFFNREHFMPMVRVVEYEQASPEVRSVYDDIMAVRGSNWVNNFW